MSEDKIEDYDKEIKKLTAKRNKLKKANEKEKFDKNKFLIGKCFVLKYGDGCGDAGSYMQIKSIKENGSITTDKICFYEKDEYSIDIDFETIDLEKNRWISQDNLEEITKEGYTEIPFKEFLEKIQDITAKSLENIFKQENESNGN